MYVHVDRVQSTEPFGPPSVKDLTGPRQCFDVGACAGAISAMKIDPKVGFSTIPAATALAGFHLPPSYIANQASFRGSPGVIGRSMADLAVAISMALLDSATCFPPWLCWNTSVLKAEVLEASYLDGALHLLHTWH